MILIAEVDRDKYNAAFWTILVYVLVIAVFSNFNLKAVGPYIENNPWTIAYAVGAYFAIGTVWSVIKWWFVLLKKRDQYETFRSSYLKRNGITGELIGQQKDDFKTKLREEFGWNKSFPPQASENKARIIAWMAYWPFSMFSTVLGDILVRVFKKIYDILEYIFSGIYRSITGLMQNISNRVFGSYSELN